MFGILPLVEEGLAKINNCGLPISPVLQLLVCLRFYATGSFQVVYTHTRTHKILFLSMFLKFFKNNISINIQILCLQLVMGDVIQISQSTISRIIFRVSCLIASNINKYIKMPISDEARSENRRLFKELGRGAGGIGLPSIDGAIDCTHIRLTHTRFENIDEVFRNRKGYFSLNVQV